MVFGAPGSGKTTLLKLLSYHTANKECIKIIHGYNIREFNFNLGGQNDFLLFIDSLDEIQNPNELLYYISKKDYDRVVCTSRFNVPFEIDFTHIITLKPLTQNQIMQLITKIGLNERFGHSIISNQDIRNRVITPKDVLSLVIADINDFNVKKSGWIDVTGDENGGKNHFVKNQAQKVYELINVAMQIYKDVFQTDDKIYVITPFRTVADSMRAYVIEYFAALGYNKEILREWTKQCIGTVHTFQGKDANEVLFVLGCSSKSSGAMNWVVKKANILNVACTRAKYRIAFIGNYEDWKNKTFFKSFIPGLIDKINV